MRNPLHALCPYFAMFPEEFVERQIAAYSKQNDLIFDPFCGRGTTILEALLHDRRAAGTDINPVAACVAGAKASAPTLSAVKKRVDQLESEFRRSKRYTSPSEFFNTCFHPTTLGQILFLRSRLNWTTSNLDRFIAAVTLGCLHGESHKSQNCLSNRMPRTISTKPGYSMRWWRSHKCVAPQRDAFDILRRVSERRLLNSRPKVKGEVKMSDARYAAKRFPKLTGKVNLIITSPPYLDTTDYQEDQWLRLWFLGGPSQPTRKLSRDDRYTNNKEYWKFLGEAWSGVADLLAMNSILVIRIGGTSLDKNTLFEGVKSSLLCGLYDFRVIKIHSGVTTEIRNRQTNVFRPGTKSQRFEHDFAFELSRRAFRRRR